MLGCHADTPATATSTPFTTDVSSTSPTSGAGSSTTGSAAGASTSTAAATSGTSDGSSASSEATLVNDVGWETGTTETKPAGCQGKIDFVFVMESDGALKGIQDQLADAFPKFIETIEEKFADFDYHIMIVDADDQWGTEVCTQDCPVLDCMATDLCCPFDDIPEGELCCYADYPCDVLDQVTECDWVLGAGTVIPAGRYASNKPCKIAEGRRYMATGQTKLSETFQCAARVGSSGDDRIGDALVASISPSLNGEGGCNEGFLRDDALLMVTLVASSYDDSVDFVYPWDWYDAVVEAKHGDASSVIALLIGVAECPFPDDYPCQFTKMFTHHLIEDRDVPDYGPAFEKATDLVTLACEDFIPQ